MKLIKQLLGKVSITVEKDDWSISKAYDRLTLITSDNVVYLSRLAVPKGIDITNKQYWKVLIDTDIQSIINQAKQYTDTAIEQAISEIDIPISDTPDAVGLIKKVVLYASDSSVGEYDNNIFEYLYHIGYISEALQAKLNAIGEALYSGEPLLIYQAITYRGVDDYSIAPKDLERIDYTKVHAEDGIVSIYNNDTLIFSMYKPEDNWFPYNP